MRKYGLKSVETSSLQIKEDEETLVVPAVITREGVYDYDGMLIYEPAAEVEKAAFTALNAWVVEEHSPEIILSKPQLIRGTVLPILCYVAVSLVLTQFCRASSKAFERLPFPYPNFFIANVLNACSSSLFTTPRTSPNSVP